MIITTGTIAESMNIDLNPALAREIGKRLKRTGWTRRLITRPNGSRVWGYESIILGHSATVENAVNDLLLSHTIEYYQRKSGIRPTDFGSDPLNHVAKAIADAVGNAEVINHGGVKSVVMPLLMWQSIIQSLPGIDDDEG